MRMVIGVALLLAAASGIRADAQPPARGRPLAIEDYYRIQTVAAPSISPNGRWVVFAVSTRIEDDNSTRTETLRGALRRVGSRRARRALRQGCHEPIVDLRQPPRVRGRAGALDRRPAEPVHVAGQSGRAPGGRGRQRRHELDRVRQGQAAAEDRARVCERVREAARGALQGRHVRLEGLSARRRAVPRAEPARAARGAASSCSRPAAAPRRSSSTPTFAPPTSPGIRTDNCSRSPPTRRGGTS